MRQNLDAFLVLMYRFLQAIICGLFSLASLCYDLSLQQKNMAYNYDEESVNALMKWAENALLPKEVTLSEAEHIFDTSLYVNANICDIKQHYPDALPIKTLRCKNDGCLLPNPTKKTTCKF